MMTKTQPLSLFFLSFLFHLFLSIFSILLHLLLYFYFTLPHLILLYISLTYTVRLTHFVPPQEADTVGASIHLTTIVTGE